MEIRLSSTNLDTKWGFCFFRAHFIHSHSHLLLVATQRFVLTRCNTLYSHWICSWTTRAKWSISRMWESFPKLSFRLIWGESYRAWIKQCFLCLAVNNPHTLCTELKSAHQHLCSAPTWSTRKHQQIKANLKDQFSLFLTFKKTTKHYMKLFLLVM